MDSNETIERKEHMVCSVIRCMETAWKEGELVDLTVTVDASKFECHSFLLGACSGYFRHILKSNKQGSASKQKRVTLKGISADTFGMILRAIYAGADIVKEDNIVDVWRGAHKLHITFLEEECNRFALCHINLRSYSSLYTVANELKVTNVLIVIQDFVAKNFNIFKDSELLLQLSADELLTILKHPNLLVKTEDFVMEAVLKWISTEPFYYTSPRITQDVNDNNQASTKSGKKKVDKDACKKNLSSEFKDVSANSDNAKSKKDASELKRAEDRPSQSSAESERDDAAPTRLDEVSNSSAKKSKKSDEVYISKCDSLIPLLQATRTCLLSSQFISRTFLNKHISSSSLARDIIFKATLYRTGYQEHGQWPNAAVHRKYSPFENVGLRLRSDGFFEAFSFEKSAWLLNTMHHQLLITEAQITVFDQDLYAAGLDNMMDTTSNVSLFVLKGLNWVKLCDFPNSTSFRFASQINLSFQTPFISQIVENSVLNHTLGRNNIDEGSDMTATAEPPVMETSPMYAINTGTILPFGMTVPPPGVPPMMDTSAMYAINTSIAPPYGIAMPPNALILPSPFPPNYPQPIYVPNTFLYSQPPPNQSPVAAIPINQPQITTTTHVRSQGSTPAKDSSSTNLSMSPSQSYSEDPNNSTTTEQTSKNTRTKPTFTQSADWISRNFHIVSLGRYIYYMNSFTHLVFKISPSFPEELLEIKYFLGNEKIEYLSTYEELLLVFCSDLDDSNKTVVYSFNTNTDQSSKSHILDGPAPGLVTFQDDINKYMLQSDGTMWTLTREGDSAINFAVLIKLWDFDFKLNGGVFYTGELYLHGQGILHNFQPKYPEIFSKIHMYGECDKGSKFVPFIILRKCWVLRDE
ncbi:kelch-like protein 28 [Biomphalaria pfeifferi]|uniref:Kelch-like protein 28 n=1 Tax=Biomphalaria pfeifferi TaxID=112525 RepID=A0AAD8AR60_BIOPF|nr:kelch-like protein 28 [Biomphalaria pfeifferi]